MNNIEENIWYSLGKVMKNSLNEEIRHNVSNKDQVVSDQIEPLIRFRVDTERFFGGIWLQCVNDGDKDGVERSSMVLGHKLEFLVRS